MKTVILAAGIGSRLKPLTDYNPKCLLKIGEKSILEMTIENILATNDSEIIIVTGYLEDKIREFLRERFPKLKITIIYNKFYASTNNIYSLWLAKDAVLGDDMMMMDSDIVFDKGINKNILFLLLGKDAVFGDDIMIMDSDIVFDKGIITKLLNSGYKNCLALKRHDVHYEEIKVKTDVKGRVVEISKEVNLTEAEGESIGIEVFGRDA